MVAAQINGMQGTGAMSEMKHFVVYNGQNQNLNTDITDQGLHELYLTPYEGGFVNGRAAATMCSYQIWRDTSTSLPGPVSSLSPAEPVRHAGQNPQTWPLNESHFSCEQPLSLNYVLRDLWGSKAMVGSDYPATHSTSGIVQGEDQEMPTQTGFFSDSNEPEHDRRRVRGPPSAFDPTGDTAPTCRQRRACSAPGGVHMAGCPARAARSPAARWRTRWSTASCRSRCSTSRWRGSSTRSSGSGCSAATTPRSRRVLHEPGRRRRRPHRHARCRSRRRTRPLGTKNGDAAVVERIVRGRRDAAQERAATPADHPPRSQRRVLVTGSAPNHTIADPTGEASTGFIDRDAINPLEQLKQFSGDPGAFTFVPANAPTGYPVPSSALSDSSTSVDRAPGPHRSGRRRDDSSLDFTTVSGNGQLAAGNYTWTGYVYVPATDTYKFRFHSGSV